MKKLLLTFISAIPGYNGFAQILDHDFDNDGVVITSIVPAKDNAYAMVALPDKSLVVAGSSYGPTYHDFALVKYREDGTLEPGFGTNGVAVTSFGPAQDIAYAIARQADGKLVVVGGSNNGSRYLFAVARYTANGQLDPAFGSGGKVITSLGTGDDIAKAVVIQPDNKILVAGYSTTSNADFAIIRYNPDGSLDPSFSFDGKVTTDLASQNDYGMGMALQPDGKIVIAGVAYQGGQGKVGMCRYDGSGALDNTFGTAGIAIRNINAQYCGAHSVALQDNKIVIAGTNYTSSSVSNFFVGRFTATGAWDVTFNSGSTPGYNSIQSANGFESAYSIAIQPDKKILVSGAVNINSGNDDFALVRLLQDGVMDVNFHQGLLTKSVGAVDGGVAVGVAADGKILVAGSTSTSVNDGDIVVLRYIDTMLLGVNDLAAIEHLVVYPNPASGQMQLFYELSEKTKVSVAIYNNLGALVEIVMPDDLQAPGKKNIIFSTKNLIPGNYYISVKTSWETRALPFIKQ
jgi:uncharacterized delta-60 repeat protein